MVHPSYSNWMESQVVNKKIWQIGQAEYYEKKVNDIKGNLPKVRSDPMKLLRRLFRDWIPAGRKPELIIKKVTEKEIFNMIAKLKNSHAYGRDLIDGSTVKLAAKYLSGPIAHVVKLVPGD